MGFLTDLINMSTRLPSKPSNEELCRSAQCGDESAREMLIVRNLPLVLKKAKRFARRGESLEDVFSDACLGLIEAIRRYRPDSKARFSTAADFSIRQAICYARRQRAAIWVTQYARDHPSSPAGEDARKALNLRTQRLAFDPPATEAHDVDGAEPLYAALRALDDNGCEVLLQWLDGERHFEGLTFNQARKIRMDTLTDLKTAFGQDDGRLAIAESRLNPRQKKILAAYRALLALGNENPTSVDICKFLGWEVNTLIGSTINKALRKMVDRKIILPRKLRSATTMEHIDACYRQLSADGKQPTRSDLVLQAGVTRSQISDFIKYKRHRGQVLIIPEGPKTNRPPNQDRIAREAKKCAIEKAENYERIRSLTGSHETVYAENTRTGRVEKMPAIRYAADQLAEALEWMNEEGEGLVLVWKKIRYVYVSAEKSFTRDVIGDTRCLPHQGTKMKDDLLAADRTSTPRGILRGNMKHMCDFLMEDY